MKISAIVLLLMMSAQSFARDLTLTCSNKEEGHKAEFLTIWRGAESLESLGQVRRKPYHSVNLICNNAEGLMEAKMNILCVGIDRTTRPSGPEVIKEKLVFTANGYQWRGNNCF